MSEYSEQCWMYICQEEEEENWRQYGRIQAGDLEVKQEEWREGGIKSALSINHSLSWLCLGGSLVQYC